jgi:transcription elongation factor Elf1
MRGSSLASRSDSLVCPLCEASKLYPSSQGSMSCRSCGTHLQGAMLETLRCISTLPDALGSHACECGHPEMRLLPDRTYHCPVCGSEVIPVDNPLILLESDEHSEAYLLGWVDSHFGGSGSFELRG